MATLINNAGVQHYANKMVLAENRKVGSKSLPTALSDIDNLIDEMKTHFDAEYGSALDMKLENNENVFSVGTGTNVDKRDEVENGFTDIELSGNSLVNLVSSEVKSMTSTRTSGWHQDWSYRYSDMIKPNTTYTIVCQVLKNTLSTPFRMGGGTKTYNQLNFNTFKSFAPKETGIKISVVQSYDEWDKTQALILFPQFGNSGEGEGLFEIGETIEYRFMIFEGDYSNNPPIDFFNGLKSVGEKKDGNHKIEILSRNENIWDITKAKKEDGSKFQYTTNNNTHILSQIGEYGIYVPFCARKGQVLNIKGRVFNVQNIRIFKESDNFKGGGIANKDYIGTDTTINNFKIVTIPEDGTYHFRIWIKDTGNAELTELMAGLDCEFDNYLPHKSDKKEISLNEPLRGLPNGVKDSIEKINGEWKIVRRCGEIILNGSEDWSKVNYNHNDLCTRIDLTIPTNSDRSDLVCNNIPVCADDNIEKENFYIAGHNHKNRFVIILPNSKLSSATIEGAKEWLSKNNATVIYLLPTPIIEDISPVTLQCWKNGTISIDEILPVETTHTVALNKPAQIKRNIEELTALKKRVQALEDFYDQVALEQAHQLSLINHSIELDYDI